MKELEERQSELIEKIEALSKELKIVEQSIADEICKPCLGEEVKQGQRMYKIASAKYGYRYRFNEAQNFKHNVKFHGYQILKDGSLSDHLTYLYMANCK